MNDLKITETINLCNLIILKTIAIKEKIYLSQNIDEDINMLITLYCREILIINRQIEFLNQIDNLS